MNDYLYPLSKVVSRKGKEIIDKFKNSCSIVWIDHLPNPMPKHYILYTNRIADNNLMKNADAVWFTSNTMYSKYRVVDCNTVSAFVPFAYDKSLETNIAIIHKDIDVLFYSETISERQKDVLNACHMKGLHALHLNTDKIGLSLQPYWSRAKVILSMHSDKKENTVNNLPMLMYGMANKIPVVSEITTDNHFQKIFNNRISIVSYDELANTCYKLCQSITERKEWSETAYDFITKSYKLEDFVSEAL